jgi:hypothetical protein
MFEDKFPSLRKMTATSFVSAVGQQTGNVPNLNLPDYPTVWSKPLQPYAAAMRTGPDGSRIGCTIEAVGQSVTFLSRTVRNPTMEFAISAASANPYLIPWSSATYMWGDVLLSGYDRTEPMQLKTFLLRIEHSEGDNVLVVGNRTGLRQLD